MRGAEVLGHSLRDSGTTKRLCVLVTEKLHPRIRDRLAAVYDDVIVVDVIPSPNAQNLLFMGRPDLLFTLTKLQIWRQTQYSKVLFLDADTLVLKNVDHLFERDELSAAPDSGWPDCFNSGVFICQPNVETFDALMKLAKEIGSFRDG